MKKVISTVVILLLLFSASSCGNKDTQQQASSVTTTSFAAVNVENNSNVSQNFSDEMHTNSSVPKVWSESDIIEYYKDAASVSSQITSVQKISLVDIVINDGAASGFIKMVKPVISKVVESNSTELTEITGGYTELCEADVKNASVTENNGCTVIKLELNDQTDSGQMSEKSGSVGHAISVIGDLSAVMSQLSDSGFPVEIEDKNVSAKYYNAYVNVTTDSSGKIINGTWKYTVTITLVDFKVMGATVNKTEVTIDNVITFNGGFA